MVKKITNFSMLVSSRWADVAPSSIEFLINKKLTKLSIFVKIKLQIDINIWKMEVALFKLTLRNSIWVRAPATNKVKIRTDIAENRIQNDNCYHTRCIYRGDLVEYFYHILIWFCNFKSRSEQIEIFKKNCFFKPILTCIQSLWKMSTIAIFYTVKIEK